MQPNELTQLERALYESLKNEPEAWEITRHARPSLSDETTTLTFSVNCPKRLTRLSVSATVTNSVQFRKVISNVQAISGRGDLVFGDRFASWLFERAAELIRLQEAFVSNQRATEEELRLRKEWELQV